MGQHHASVDEIFFEALKLTSESERTAFVKEACQGNTDLRDRVERLLQAYPEADSFLESAAAPVKPTIDQPITEQSGTQIGPYRLLQQLGEGGMGVVYVAEQREPVRRRVALKIIKPGMDTRQVIARFEAERQALAVMDHPNIAKVFDAGQTETGRPYFVMELVNGISITQYCDEQHLTPKDRLKLLLPICQAIQHAHQKGVIHRDLKPSNILVALYDGQAVPKVIDFGVAKATSQTLTEKTVFTQIGQIVGTLEYMSPEQAQRNQLDVDTRTDIYSLGVVLYELLTGETPFDRQRLRSAAFDEMLRIIREEEPPKPSTKVSTSESLPSIAANRHVEPRKLSTLIRGELDWIVMKALEKDRARRYETATGLANDIQRYVNGETVLACPPSRAYTFRKFARRNQAALVTSAIVALGLIVGSGVATWQAVLATDAKQKALEQQGLAERRLTEVNLQRRRADDQRRLAEANLLTALDAVDRMLLRVGEEKLEHVPRFVAVRDELLNDALCLYQSLAEDRPLDPELRFLNAVCRQCVSRIQLLLGRGESAYQSTQKSLADLKAVVTESPNAPHTELALARGHILAGRIQAHLGARDAAIKHYEQAMTLVDDLPTEDSKANAELAYGLRLLANSQLQTGERESAKTNFDRANSLYQKLTTDDPTNTRIHLQSIKNLQNYGNLFYSQGDLGEAYSRYRDAMKQARTVAEDHPENDEAWMVLSVAMLNVGNASAQSQPNEAERRYRDAVEIQERLVSEYPAVPDYRYRLAMSLGNQAAHFSNLGRPVEARDAAEQAVLRLQKLCELWPGIPKYRHMYGGTLSNFATLLLMEGKELDRAAALLSEAVQNQQLALKENPQNVKCRVFLLNHYVALAEVRAEQQRWDLAISACTNGETVGKQLVEELPRNQSVANQLSKLRQIQQQAKTMLENPK